MITIQATIKAPIHTVWECWHRPEHIVQWAFASDAWEAPAAENDLQVAGRFNITMAAKDKSASFNFTGTYTQIKENELIEYDIDDGRHVKIEFQQTEQGVEIKEFFDPESENPEEVQRAGWQAILNNFKTYVEKNT